jgi:chorismate dehydratase
MSVLTPPKPDTTAPPSSCSSIRAGVVSFLNARPLVAGLESLSGWSIESAPPSRLLDLLADNQVDLALCSSVDLLTAPFEVAWLASTPLACCGATRTVRLFSHHPIDELRTIHCDTDSHTSVALLRILLLEYWGIEAECVPLDDPRPLEAQLLIGDKVVSADLTPQAWPVQVDLGEAWLAHTGLPFVFAVWMGRSDRARCIERAGRVIDRQLRLNRHRLHELIAREAPALGWSCQDASDYLTAHIRYDFGDPEMAGLMSFLEKCREHGCAPDRAIPPPLAI